MIFILIFSALLFLLNILSLKANDDIFFNYNVKPLKFLKIDESMINLIISIIKTSEHDTIKLIMKSEIFAGTIFNFTRSNNISFVDPLIENILYNETNPFLDKAIDLLKYDDSSVLVYIKKILNYINSNNKNDTDFNIILNNLQCILNYPQIDELCSYFKEHSDIVLQLAKNYIYKTQFSKLYELIDTFISNNRDILFDLSINLIRVYNDSDRMADIIIDFTHTFNDTMADFTNISFSKTKEIMEELSKLIKFKDKAAEILKNELFSNQESTLFLIHFFFDKNMIITIINIIKNINNEEYKINAITDILKDFFNSYKGNDKNFESMLNFARNIIMKAVKGSFNQNEFKEIIVTQIMNKIKQYFFDKKITVDVECHNLLEIVFFSNYSNVAYFYAKKMALETSLGKNDFLTYQNCLNNEDFPELANLKYTIKPTFIIGIYDDLVNKDKFKNSSLNEKYNYLTGYCLPYGLYKNENDGKEICQKKDYISMVTRILRLFYDINPTDIDAIILNYDNFLLEEYIIAFFCILLVLIPLLIWIFLHIYRGIKIRQYEKEKIINELIDEETNPNIFKNINLNDNDNREKINKFTPKKWYKYLYIYFNITKNGAELFNFSISETNFNNLNGMTYIKGILGISMILYVLGQVYIILFNLPTKAMSQTGFYDIVKNPIYGIIYISLRYIPRIILSCSGYIFVYKFLNFIEQNQNNYFWKFLFIQSYKYIILLFVVLFMRYCLYYLDIFIHFQKRPTMEIYKYNLDKENYLFYGKLFSFLLVNSANNKFTKRQNLVQYFYLPLNEMILFLFGTILISIAYRFKLRIDLIIIILGFIIYMTKIFVFIFDLKNKEYFTTLYFYLYDYGELMLNPIFNIPYYLIGIYFGFINFSIQKGISIYKNEHKESYSMIEKLDNNDEINEINDINERENDDNTAKIELIDIDSKLENQNRNTYKIDLESQDNQSVNNTYSYRKNNLKKRKKSSIKTNNKMNEKIESKIQNKNNINAKTKELDDKIKEMPFLISPIKFLNIHRKLDYRCCYGTIILFFFIFIIFNITLQQIFLFDLFDLKDDKEKNEKNYFINLLENFITDKYLNIFYLIDIELVVFMINWIFFILYSRSEKSADIFDFFNTKYWSFFVKSYFSFTIISTPIIISTFYESETVISLELGNIFLYYFINLIFILVGDIIVYSCFEFPFKKIFKSFFITEEIINMEYDEENEKYIDWEKSDEQEEHYLKNMLH